MPRSSESRLLHLLLAGVCWAASSASATDTAARRKRGVSGLAGCGDAVALNLRGSWEYNWGLWPTGKGADGDDTHVGSQPCRQPRTAEFVPMFWGCGGNCTGLKIPHE